MLIQIHFRSRHFCLYCARSSYRTILEIINLACGGPSVAELETAAGKGAGGGMAGGIAGVAKGWPVLSSIDVCALVSLCYIPKTVGIPKQVVVVVVVSPHRNTQHPQFTGTLPSLCLHCANRQQTPRPSPPHNQPQHQLHAQLTSAHSLWLPPPPTAERYTQQEHLLANRVPHRTGIRRKPDLDPLSSPRTLSPPPPVTPP